MNMCENCGYIFEEPMYHRYCDGEVYSCPRCDVEDFSEVKCCKVCGEWFREDDMEGEKVCKKCAEKETTPENVLQYIQDDKLEKEFFVEWLTCSEVKLATSELIEICKEAWGKIIDKNDELIEFAKANWEEFVEWMDCASL